jgi:hypothetical protein
MSTRSAVVALLLLGLGSISSARAEGLAIKGVVKGTDGKPLAGAEVRAQRLDGKGSVVVATTNAKGEYNLRGLTLAGYKVTAVINKVPKSVASINTHATGWVRVDFDMTATAKNKPAGKKHMVWVPGETGSHIGSGHWEEAQDANTGTGASAVQRVDGAALRTQNILNPVGAATGPGQ